MRCEKRAGGVQELPYFLAGGRQCLLRVPATQHCPRLFLPGHGHFEGRTILPISESWYPVNVCWPNEELHLTLFHALSMFTITVLMV